MIAISREYYQAQAEIAKALAHPVRIEIIDLLTEHGDLCVSALTDLLDVSQSSVSKHLGILRQAGLVEARREGLQAFYHIRTPCVSGFFKCLEQILKEDLEQRQEKLTKSDGDENE